MRYEANRGELGPDSPLSAWIRRAEAVLDREPTLAEVEHIIGTLAYLRAFAAGMKIAGEATAAAVDKIARAIVEAKP